MIIIKPINKEAYHTFWQEHDLHILQSVKWGNIKASEGWQIWNLGVFQDGLLIFVLSIQGKKVGLNKFAYLPKLQNFRYWQELAGYCKHELKLDFLIVEFATPPFVISPLLVPYHDHIQPEQTNVVPLHKSEDELFMALKGNYRGNIKKAEKDNLLCNFYNAGEEMALDKFYTVLQQVFANTKFLPRPKSYFAKVWQELSASQQVVIATAELRPGSGMEPELLGAYLIVTDKLGAYELYGGVTRNGRDHEAGYLLKWEAIKYFNNRGQDFYDHWGVSKKLPDGSYQHDELYNISSFKEGFGGVYSEFYPAQVLVINPKKYQLFQLLKKGGKVWTKLKKLLK